MDTTTRTRRDAPMMRRQTEALLNAHRMGRHAPSGALRLQAKRELEREVEHVLAEREAITPPAARSN